MSDEKGGPGGEGDKDKDKAMSEELRQLGHSLSTLGRTVFEEGRVLSVDLLRSARGAVDRARQEIERMARERK